MDNRQAIAYAVVALRNLGYGKREIRDFVEEMKLCMDLKTEAEVEKEAYRILD